VLIQKHRLFYHEEHEEGKDNQAVNFMCFMLFMVIYQFLDGD